MEAIKSLYQEEINAYKGQVEELKSQNRRADEKNAALLDKVKDLQELIERADVANKDLHTAFEHVREENMKLQLQPVNQQNAVNDRSIEMEHEMALEQVRSQYINLTRESVSWISDKDKLSQKVKFLERECQRFTRDNMVLGKQVRHLLKSLEEERGTIIRRANQINEYGQQPVNASDVIDNHLVTFESIEELQQQNQKLIALVKDLTEKEEQREIKLENEDIRRLNIDIESLKSQLEQVKNDRERIISVFNTILKERDLFKILLCKTRQVEHMTPEIFQRMVSIACSAGPAITNEPESSPDKDAHITDLKAMISKLEQELSDLRSNLEVIRTRNEEELNLKTRLLEQAHLKILEESQHAEVLKERNQVLESNISQLTAEFDELRTKAQKLTFQVEKLDSELEREKEKLLAIEKELEREKEKATELEGEKDRANDLAKELERKVAKVQELEGEKEKAMELAKELEREKEKAKELEREREKAREKERAREREEEKGKEKERGKEEKLSGLLDQIQTVLSSNVPADFYTKLGDIQTLRNHERALRLKKVKRSIVSEVIVEEKKEEDVRQEVEEKKEENIEENKPDEVPPAKGIVLKRRKFD